MALISSKEVRLTPMEFNLLHYLLTRVGQFIKPKDILGEVWGRSMPMMSTCSAPASGTFAGR